jgi:plastocyanin
MRLPGGETVRGVMVVSALALALTLEGCASGNSATTGAPADTAATPTPQTQAPVPTQRPAPTPTIRIDSQPCGSTIFMDDLSFSVASCTVKRGATLTFANQSGDEPHVLCFGHLQRCVPNAAGPAEMNTLAGVTIDPGKRYSLTFTKVGVYQITCLVHPVMDMAVGVTP